MAAAHRDDAPLVGDSRPIESVWYEAAIARLRASGCKCVLYWNGQDAAPHPLLDVERGCVIHDNPCASTGM